MVAESCTKATVQVNHFTMMDSHKISGNDSKQIEEVNTREERRERDIIEGGKGKGGFRTVLKSGECVSSSSLLLPCLLN